MIIEEKFRKAIEADLRKLPFVQWDRFTKSEDQLTIFGWIDRKDAYKDFVVLRFNPHQMWFVMSSSKERGEEIGRILGTGHNTCERAETYFKISNVVKL